MNRRESRDLTRKGKAKAASNDLGERRGERMGMCFIKLSAGKSSLVLFLQLLQGLHTRLFLLRQETGTFRFIIWRDAWDADGKVKLLLGRRRLQVCIPLVEAGVVVLVAVRFAAPPKVRDFVGMLVGRLDTLRSVVKLGAAVGIVAHMALADKRDLQLVISFVDELNKQREGQCRKMAYLSSA